MYSFTEPELLIVSLVLFYHIYLTSIPKMAYYDMLGLVIFIYGNVILIV